MQRQILPDMNIAIIGGDEYCKEVLEKTTVEYRQRDVNARFHAVADPDPNSPGIRLAKSLGLVTVDDYHRLYDPKYNIHLFIILSSDEDILQDVLRTKPSNIRVQSYQVFTLFWRILGIEAGKLRDRNKEIEMILNGIEDFLLVISPQLELLDVNESFLKRMGCSRDEMIGRKCHEVFQNLQEPCSAVNIPCPLTAVIRNKRPNQHVMTRVGQDGKKSYWEITIYPVWEKGGKISKFIEISRDITKRYKEEEEITRRLEEMVEERTQQLKETHAKLLHQDKMASLGKLSASVVHEINNPIAGILNLTMLIKRIIEEGPVTEEEMQDFKEYLDLMETETRRTSGIVSNLLSFSRESGAEMTHLDLNRLVDRTLFLNMNLLKINNIKVEKQFDPDLPQIEGSPDQLQQVFMNLISNAVEAMEKTDGGLLSIRTQYAPNKEKARVFFEDTGVGIPAGLKPKLFDPFFTTKSEGKGVGLGLSVVYGLLEEHGGTIDVFSEEGKGSTFLLEFPAKGSHS